MISSFYASLLAVLVIWLSQHVVRLRRAKKVRLGDGGDLELRSAIRAHGNATEYVPLSLILLVLSELNGAHWAVLHTAGIAMVSGRLLHARGLLTDRLRDRVLGMQLTVFALMGLAVVNVGYAVYRLVAT